MLRQHGGRRGHANFKVVFLSDCSASFSPGRAGCDPKKLFAPRYRPASTSAALDFRAWRALEIAQLIIGIMGLRLISARRRPNLCVWSYAGKPRKFSIMTISQQFLDVRNSIFRARQITSGVRMYPDVLYIDNHDSGIRRSNFQESAERPCIS